MKKIVGISGTIGSGKSFAAEHLVAQGFTLVKFADALKIMYRSWLTDLVLSCERRIEGDRKESVDHTFSRLWEALIPQCREMVLTRSLLVLEGDGYIKPGKFALLIGSLIEWSHEHLDNNRDITPRYIMQHLGTEWGRHIHGEDFWVDMWRNKIQDIERVVCDDVRFKNEAAAIGSSGGFVIKLLGKNKPGKHESEQMDVPHEVAIRNTYDRTFLTLINQAVEYDGR